MNEKSASISAAVAAALASVCCFVPLIGAMLGVAIIGAGALAFFETLRPFLILLTLGLLGFTGYQIYLRRCDDPACAPSGGSPALRVLFWAVAILSIVLITLPYWLPAIL